MSRTFHPPHNQPETLSKEDMKTMADVRRNIWTNALKGMGLGAMAGYSLHYLAQRFRAMAPHRFDRSTVTLAVLGGASLGSFLMATVTGKNQVHRLHPIFEIGARKPQHLQEEEEEQQQQQQQQPQLQQQHQMQLQQQHHQTQLQLQQQQQQQQQQQKRYQEEEDLLLRDVEVLQQALDGEWEELERNRILRKKSLHRALTRKGEEYWIERNDTGGGGSRDNTKTRA